MHISRHNHACHRQRGAGGRLLSLKEREAEKAQEGDGSGPDPSVSGLGAPVPAMNTVPSGLAEHDAPPSAECEV
jgi:hypothetical protein